MIFNSYIFIFIFLPITWLTFHYCRTKFGIGVSFKVLSTASLIYYAWWNPPFIFLPLASVVFNFFWGKKISCSENPKSWVIVGIILNLVLLGYFKYAMFFIDNLNLFSGNEFDVPSIILPHSFVFSISGACCATCKTTRYTRVDARAHSDHDSLYRACA